MPARNLDRLRAPARVPHRADVGIAVRADVVRVVQAGVLGIGARDRELRRERTPLAVRRRRRDRPTRCRQVLVVDDRRRHRGSCTCRRRAFPGRGASCTRHSIGTGPRTRRHQRCPFRGPTRSCRRTTRSAGSRRRCSRRGVRAADRSGEPVLRTGVVVVPVDTRVDDLLAEQLLVREMRDRAPVLVTSVTGVPIRITPSVTDAPSDLYACWSSDHDVADVGSTCTGKTRAESSSHARLGAIVIVHPAPSSASVVATAVDAGWRTFSTPEESHICGCGTANSTFPASLRNTIVPSSSVVATSPFPLTCHVHECVLVGSSASTSSSFTTL